MAVLASSGALYARVLLPKGSGLRVAGSHCAGAQGRQEFPRETRSPPLPDCQGTVIVERWWKVPLAGDGRKPRLHRRHRVYKLVEDTKHGPKGNLELILTQSVVGKARQRYLLPQAGPVWRQLFPALPV